jgi:rubredoxin
MVARVTCKVVDTMDVGRYVLFLCDGVDGEILGEGRMLTVDEFLGKGAAAVPPTATVYRTLEEVGSWVCPWCGFVYHGEKLPDGYVCPLCGCPGDKFIRKEGE